jgi:hypothetical protein
VYLHTICLSAATVSGCWGVYCSMRMLCEARVWQLASTWGWGQQHGDNGGATVNQMIVHATKHAPIPRSANVQCQDEHQDVVMEQLAPRQKSQGLTTRGIYQVYVYESMYLRLVHLFPPQRGALFRAQQQWCLWGIVTVIASPCGKASA